MSHTLPEGVPALDELKSQGMRWVLWKQVQLEGRPKPTKVPFTTTGSQASSTNPKSWALYEACAARLATNPGAYGGLGFVVKLADRLGEPAIIGVDLDDCRDPDTGLIEEWAIRIIDRFKSYTEISPSGRGLRIFVRGVLPFGAGGGRKGKIECYADSRYLTVTGNYLDTYPDEIAEAQEAIEWLWVGEMGKVDAGGGPLDSSGALDQTQFPYRKHEALLEVDPTYKRVWQRNYPKLKDQSLSAYDFSLAVRAAALEWSEGEIVALIREFRHKHGETLKANRPDYLLRTARLAIQHIKAGGDTNLHKGDQLDVLRMKASLLEAKDRAAIERAGGQQERPPQEKRDGPAGEQAAPAGPTPPAEGSPPKPIAAPPKAAAGGGGNSLPPAPPPGPPPGPEPEDGPSELEREEARATLLARLGVPITALVQIGSGGKPDYLLRFEGIAEPLHLGGAGVLWSHAAIKQAIAACNLFGRPIVIPPMKALVWDQMVARMLILRELREADTINETAEMREMLLDYLADNVPTDMAKLDHSITRSDIIQQRRPFYESGRLFVNTRHILASINVGATKGVSWREMNSFLGSRGFKGITLSVARTSRYYWTGRSIDLLGDNAPDTEAKDQPPPF